MTMKAKPGNQPDPSDMAAPAAEGVPAADLTVNKLEDQEEEAARLSDFA